MATVEALAFIRSFAWLIIDPSTVGEHTIHETEVFHVDPSDPSKDINVEVLWHVPVVPHNR